MKNKFKKVDRKITELLDALVDLEEAAMVEERALIDAAQGSSTQRGDRTGKIQELRQNHPLFKRHSNVLRQFSKNPKLKRYFGMPHNAETLEETYGDD